MLTFDCSQRDIDSVVKSDTVVPWGGSAACGFNRTHYRALEVPLERYQVYNATNYEFDSGTTFWSEFSYSSVDSTSQFEPVPFNSEDMFGGLGHLGYNVSNPYMPAAIRDAAVAAQGGVQALDANGNAIPNKFVHETDFLSATGDVLIPAGGELQVPFIRRLAEFGTRGSENTRQTFRASMGLEGTFSNGFDWDAHYSYGFVDRKQISGAYNAANFAYAVNAVTDTATGNIVCADEIARARNCVPINVFGIDSMSPEAVAYVRANTSTHSKNKQRTAAFNVTGDFNLMGLNASFAAGVERREERSDDRPDALQLAGLHGGNKVAATFGEYSVNGYYAELLLPLIQGMPYVDELVFETAYRVDHYSTAGSVDAMKFGLSWVVNDDIRFRSVISESVRAPSIDDLYAGQAQSYTGIPDICAGVGDPDVEPNKDPVVVANCLSDPRIAATAALGRFDVDLNQTIPGFSYSQPQLQTISGFTGGNENLLEESADTTTIGLVWTPTYVEGLAVTLDYYSIEIDDVISSVSASRLLRECYESPNYPNVSQCDAHERYPTGHLRYWYSYGVNQSTYESTGMDLAVGYTFETLGPVPGELDIRGIWTNRDKHEFATTASSTPFDYVGEVGYNDDIARLNFVWTTDDWLVSLQANYYSDALDDVSYAPDAYGTEIASNQVDEMIYLDLQVRYDLTDSLDIYYGMDNVSNQQPPYCPNCNNEPVPGAHYTAESYARVWNSKYHYVGFRWNL
jgi:outer membrane receptor protein involved in Fe transport